MLSDATFKMFSVSRQRLGAHFNCFRTGAIFRYKRDSARFTWIEEDRGRENSSSHFDNYERNEKYTYTINLLISVATRFLRASSSFYHFRYLHKRRDVTHVLIGCRLERKLANRNDCSAQMECSSRTNCRGKNKFYLFYTLKIIFYDLNDILFVLGAILFCNGGSSSCLDSSPLIFGAILFCICSVSYE